MENEILQIPWSKIDPGRGKDAETFDIRFEGFIDYLSDILHKHAVHRFEKWWYQQVQKRSREAGDHV